MPSKKRKQASAALIAFLTATGVGLIVVNIDTNDYIEYESRAQYEQERDRLLDKVGDNEALTLAEFDLYMLFLNKELEESEEGKWQFNGTEDMKSKIDTKARTKKQKSGKEKVKIR